MNKPIFLLLLAGIVVVAAISVRLRLAYAGYKSEPINQTPSSQTVKQILVTSESTSEPATCEFLGDPSLAVGPEVSQKYGEIRSCFLLDNRWVILTEGLKNQNGTRQSGVVADYRCTTADSTC